MGRTLGTSYISASFGKKTLPKSSAFRCYLQKGCKQSSPICGCAWACPRSLTFRVFLIAPVTPHGIPQATQCSRKAVPKLPVNSSVPAHPAVLPTVTPSSQLRLGRAQTKLQDLIKWLQEGWHHTHMHMLEFTAFWLWNRRINEMGAYSCPNDYWKTFFLLLKCNDGGKNTVLLFIFLFLSFWSFH